MPDERQRSPGLPAVGDVFDRYRIVRTLGFGGMGAVFVAEQINLDRHVALKVLLPQFVTDADYRERFTREAAVLARLDSPHIVQIYDYGEHDGCLFIATQLVRGGDLAQRIGEGVLPVGRAARVAEQLCSALSDAHRLGVIHRDVKPKNILMRATHHGEHAYLCDFGIAKAAGEGNTTEGMVIGTWGYLAPERCRGAPASPASDIYSLGCVFDMMLTGSPPFGGTEAQLILAHLESPIPQLPGGGSAVHLVNQVLSRSMAKDPADRYAEATLMAQDLRMIIRLEEEAEAADSPTVIVPTPAAATPPPRGPSSPAGTPSDAATAGSSPGCDAAAPSPRHDASLPPRPAASPAAPPPQAPGTPRPAVAAPPSGVPPTSPTDFPPPGRAPAAQAPQPPSERGGQTPDRPRRRWPLIVAIMLLAMLAPAGGYFGWRALRPESSPHTPPTGTSDPKPGPKPDPAQPSADYDGDGRDDMAIEGLTGVQIGLSAGKSLADPVTVPDTDARDWLRADVNGDGKTDLIGVPDKTASETDAVVLAAGDDLDFTPLGSPIALADPSGGGVATADLEGDGYGDLVQATDDAYLVSSGSADGLGKPRPAGTPVTTDPDGVAYDDVVRVAADFTGDGLGDMLVIGENPAGSTVQVQAGDGQRFGDAVTWSQQPSWRLSDMRVAIGDFDGDGRADVGRLTSLAGGGMEFSVLRSDGSRFRTPSVLISDPSADGAEVRVAAIDVDEDGDADLAAISPDGAVTLRLWRKGELVDPLQWGAFPDWSVPESTLIGIRR